MGPDSLHDGAVVEEDKDQWEQVVEDAHEHDVAPVVEVIAQVVIATGHKQPLDGVPSPETCS